MEAQTGVSQSERGIDAHKQSREKVLRWYSEEARISIAATRAKKSGQPREGPSKGQDSSIFGARERWKKDEKLRREYN